MSGLVYGSWRRAVVNGPAVIGREELKERSMTLRPAGRMWIRTDHYQIHGMPTPPLLEALAGEHDDPGAFLSVLSKAELIGRHATVVWQDRVVLESVLGSAGYLLHHGDPRALLLRRFQLVRQRWLSPTISTAIISIGSRKPFPCWKPLTRPLPQASLPLSRCWWSTRRFQPLCGSGWTSLGSRPKGSDPGRTTASGWSGY